MSIFIYSDAEALQPVLNNSYSQNVRLQRCTFTSPPKSNSYMPTCLEIILKCRSTTPVVEHGFNDREL